MAKMDLIKGAKLKSFGCLFLLQQYNLIIVPIVECISKLTTHKITLLTTRFRFSPPFGFRTAHFPHVQFLLRPKSICSWHFTNLSIVRH